MRTQEEKELLLKELCARLPYGVKYLGYSWKYDIRQKLGYIDTLKYIDKDGNIGTNRKRKITVEDIKPYLYPLSSMTEEQKDEYTCIVNYMSPEDTDNWVEGEFIYVNKMNALLHFYNKYHLDYNGLIPKGLALDATGRTMYQ